MNSTLLYGLFFQGIEPLVSEHLIEHQEISNYIGASWLRVIADEEGLGNEGKKWLEK